MPKLPAVAASGPAGHVILNLLPVMDDLDKAAEFYHRLLGLDSNVGDPVVTDATASTRQILERSAG